MERISLAKLDQWHEEDKHQLIADTIAEVPETERDYEMDSRLARALNNLTRYTEALDILLKYKLRGEAEPLWHFRLGYAYFYLDQDQEAEKEFLTVLSMTPEDEDAWYLLALIYIYSLKNPKGLEQAVSRLAELNSPYYQELLGLLSDNEDDDEDYADYDPERRFTPSKPFDANYVLVRDMAEDEYYPAFLVEKVQTLIRRVIHFLEAGSSTYREIMEQFDRMTLAINDLAEEFEANDSEIETAARDSIGQTVQDILDWFDIEIDCETAIRERDW